MPVPKPRTGENRSRYVSRFMRAESGSGMSQRQKLAVAYKEFRSHKKKRKKK